MKMNRTTKYLIPTIKPNQFDPIPITGEWEYIASKNVGFATMRYRAYTERLK